MTEQRNLLDLATKYHIGLPARIRQYLNKRGIPDVLIDFHLLGWNGWRITIPIFNYGGDLVFFKLAKDPDDASSNPKMIAWPGGNSVELYGWEHVRRKPSQIVICEGEFDRLVLEEKGFFAVTSTGGAGTFRSEWAKEFEAIPDVFICFDRDEAGRSGAARVGRMISQAKIVELPEEVGESGDITDFFVRLGKSKEDLQTLMAQAKPAPPLPQPVVPEYLRTLHRSSSLSRERIDHIKHAQPIARVIGHYVTLRTSGINPVGLCPFHADQNPSLTVYPASGTFYCYGCHMHGDVITFLMAIEHLSFNQALDALEASANNHDRESQPRQ